MQKYHSNAYSTLSKTLNLYNTFSKSNWWKYLLWNCLENCLKIRWSKYGKKTLNFLKSLSILRTISAIFKTFQVIFGNFYAISQILKPIFIKNLQLYYILKKLYLIKRIGKMRWGGGGGYESYKYLIHIGRYHTKHYLKFHKMNE